MPNIYYLIKKDHGICLNSIAIRYLYEHIKEHDKLFKMPTVIFMGNDMSTVRRQT